jgi:hypothetical protein
MYPGWNKEELKRRRRPDKRHVEGLILCKPMCLPDTPSAPPL